MLTACTTPRVRRGVVALAAGIVLWNPTSTTSQTNPPPTARRSTAQAPSVDRNTLLRQGVEATVEHRYQRAEELFRRVGEMWPDDPLPILLQAAGLYAQMQDLENYARSDEFLALLDSTRNLARRRLERGPTADDYFSLATAEGYLAYLALREHRYLSAYRHGIAARSGYRKALELDSTYCDAAVGIGSFLYWRGKALRFLSWLPFVSDRRQEGIDRIVRAIPCTRFGRWTALSNLCWVLLDAGKPEEALRWAEEGLQRFPSSRFFLWPAAEACFRLGRWKEAELLFSQILQGLKGEPKSSGYNELICLLKVAQCRQERGDLEGALAAVSAALSTRVGDGVKSRAEHLFEQARKKYAELQRQLSEVRSPER